VRCRIYLKCSTESFPESPFAKNGEAGDIRLIIAPLTLLASTLILATVGLISGMIPAFRASRLDPIEALRYE